MKNASTLFTESQRTEIEKAVRDAEARTSCEIVPVVATASGRYDRPEDIVGLWLATGAAVTVWLCFPHHAGGAGTWGGMPTWLRIGIMISAVVGAFIIGAWIGSRIGWLRRLFTPRQQMIQEVETRARGIFFDKRVHHTTGGTGLLIYISLFEHMAVVLGDQTIIEKLGQPFLAELREKLTRDLQTGDISSALTNSIHEAASRLASHLPRATDDVNEFHDTLILLD